MYEIIVGSLALLGGLFGSLLASYFKKKGEHLATKEDIAEITDQVEAVRSEYSHEIERLKNDLEKILVVSRIQIEREVKVYEDLCDVLGVLRSQYYTIMPGASGFEGPEKMKKFYKDFHARLKELQIFLDRKSPFFAPQIKEKAFKIMDLAWDRAAHSQLSSPELIQNFWKEEKTIRKEYFVLHEEVYELVRKRIEEMKG